MLLLLLIAVDFGRLFLAHISNVNAAREAANYAAAHAADSPYDSNAFNTGSANAAIEQANAQGQSGGGVVAVASPFCFSPAAPSTSIDCNAASNFAPGSGNDVTVTVSQPFTFWTPLIGNLFGGSLTLTTSATAPVLNPLVATVVTQTSTSTSTTTSSTSTTTSSTTTSTSTTIHQHDDDPVLRDSGHHDRPPARTRLAAASTTRRLLSSSPPRSLLGQWPRGRGTSVTARQVRPRAPLTTPTRTRSK